MRVSYWLALAGMVGAATAYLASLSSWAIHVPAVVPAVAAIGVALLGLVAALPAVAKSAAVEWRRDAERRPGGALVHPGASSRYKWGPRDTPCAGCRVVGHAACFCNGGCLPFVSLEHRRIDGGLVRSGMAAAGHGGRAGDDGNDAA